MATPRVRVLRSSFPVKVRINRFHNRRRRQLSMKSTSSSCPILTIPNEVLHHILSFISPSNSEFISTEDFLEYKSNSGHYNATQPLVLRSVCRRFRAITLELDFWYDPYFRFTHLISGWYEDRWHPLLSFQRYYHEKQFLQALFGDRELVDALARRKKEWMFDSIAGIESVIQYIPGFTQTARAIHLEMCPDEQYEEWHSQPLEDQENGSAQTSLDTAIHCLSVCSDITTLSIRSAYVVDLNEIASSFPLLQNFHCSDTEFFIGSLSPLVHLKKLHMDTDMWSDDIETTIQPTIQTWFPLQAIHLTHLTLTCGAQTDTLFNSSTLLTFPNLKSLDIGPLNREIADFLLNLQCHLEIFQTDLIIDLAPIDTVIAVLRAPCLQTVKEFVWRGGHSDRRLESTTLSQYWLRFYDAFTSMLSSVEHVRLAVPFHIESCALFSRMKNLKILDWGDSSSLYAVVMQGPDERKMVDALENAFAEFPEKPKLAVYFKARK